MHGRQRKAIYRPLESGAGVRMRARVHVEKGASLTKKAAHVDDDD